MVFCYFKTVFSNYPLVPRSRKFFVAHTDICSNFCKFPLLVDKVQVSRSAKICTYTIWNRCLNTFKFAWNFSSLFGILLVTFPQFTVCNGKLLPVLNFPRPELTKRCKNGCWIRIRILKWVPEPGDKYNAGPCGSGSASLVNKLWPVVMLAFC